MIQFTYLLWLISVQFFVSTQNDPFKSLASCISRTLYQTDSEESLQNSFSLENYQWLSSQEGWILFCLDKGAWLRDYIHLGYMIDPSVPCCCRGESQEKSNKDRRRVTSRQGSHCPKPAFWWGCIQLPLLARSGLDLCLIHWSRAWKPSRWACPQSERRKINLAGKREPPRAQCTLHNPIY